MIDFDQSVWMRGSVVLAWGQDSRFPASDRMPRRQCVPSDAELPGRTTDSGHHGQSIVERTRRTRRSQTLGTFV